MLRRYPSLIVGRPEDVQLPVRPSATGSANASVRLVGIMGLGNMPQHLPVNHFMLLLA